MWHWLCCEVGNNSLPWFICPTADWVEGIQDRWARSQKRVFENCKGATQLRLVEDLARESLHLGVHEVCEPMNHEVDAEMIRIAAEDESLGGQALRELVIKKLVERVYKFDTCRRKTLVRQQLREFADAQAHKHVKEGVAEAFRVTLDSHVDELRIVQSEFGQDSRETSIKEGVMEWSKRGLLLQVLELETARQNLDQIEAALRYNLELIRSNRDNLALRGPEVL